MRAREKDGGSIRQLPNQSPTEPFREKPDFKAELFISVLLPITSLA
jgi:hypothetical protein